MRPLTLIAVVCGIALSSLLAFADEAASPNCDPEKGAADIEHCPALRRELLQASFCMNRGDPCDSDTARLIRPLVTVTHGDRQSCSRFLHSPFEYVDLATPDAPSLSDSARFPNLTPIRLRGQVYLETRTPGTTSFAYGYDMLSAIYVSEGRSVKKMCEFRYRSSPGANRRFEPTAASVPLPVPSSLRSSAAAQAQR